MQHDKIRQWLDGNADEPPVLPLMVIRKITPVLADSGQTLRWDIEARRPRRGSWFALEVVAGDRGYYMSRTCCDSALKEEFRDVTELADFLHVLNYYVPDLPVKLSLSLECEVKTWKIPMVNRQLREDYLLTRVYSMSEIKVTRVDGKGAHVAYRVYFRDLGMDFDTRFDASMHWDDTHGARVEVSEASWRKPVVVKTDYAGGLAECVFGHFRREHERLVTLTMGST